MARPRFLFSIFCIGLIAAAPAPSPSIAWQPWSDGQFAKAKKENRFVLLDLEAVWCHWCHVMNDTTYADPAVQKLMGEKYIAVRVDQDSRPDIANRYEDYGWPATVVFDSSGHEIVKRRGYLPPREMASMLQAIIDDPTPGPSVQAQVDVRPAASPALADPQRAELIGRLKSDYDEKNEGWFGEQKFIDPSVIEYCLIDGDSDLQRMARQTLKANLKLIDPVWGGVDQYSSDSDWDHPHFEKIMLSQADDMRVYAQAYLATGDGAYLKAAEQIHSFLTHFLMSPEGAFYVSQDADLHPGEHSADYFKLNDSDRRKLGVPRVDQHCYARENGWAIRSLCMLYAATGDRAVLDQAIVAANWVMKNRSLGDGGFRHDETDAAGPYLGDTLAMGDAFLTLYETTADRVWLGRAQACMKFISGHFSGKGSSGVSTGLATAASSDQSMLPARPEVDENVDAARLANLLFAYTGVTEDRDLAAGVVRYLAAPELSAHRGWAVGGILLADREINSVPLHVTIVAPKSDAVAAELFRTALQAPTAFKRVDWFDKAEGNLPNTDVNFPALPYAAAFLCTGTACSSPIRSAETLAAKLKRAAAANPSQGN